MIRPTQSREILRERSKDFWNGICWVEPPLDSQGVIKDSLARNPLPIADDMSDPAVLRLGEHCHRHH